MKCVKETVFEIPTHSVFLVYRWTDTKEQQEKKKGPYKTLLMLTNNTDSY